MGFTSLLFYIFALFAAAIYLMVKKNQWGVLLLLSIIFYATWEIEKIPFILAAACIAWTAGLLIGLRYDKTDANDRELKNKAKQYARIVALIAVVLLLSMLMYVKVGTLLVKSLALDGKVSIIVPVGISYYTFSLIGYVLDCYWRKEQYEKNYFKLLLFASYFPKVLQGPIVKYRDLGPQLVAEHRFDYKNLCYGLQLMLWGYFKKLVIADRLAIFVNTVYGDYQHKSGSMLLVATIFGAFQLYCDFSGCMDIAAGFSEILGIKLHRNFNHPFFSESASEFWRRWHITLGTWFKDYVYMPLTISPLVIKAIQKVRNRFGMSTAKYVGAIIPIIVVWILTGLWHGTGTDFVIWGMYWAILIIQEILFSSSYARINKILHINTESIEWRAFRRIRTFVLFTFGRMITLPGNIHASGEVVKKIITDFCPWQLVDGTLYTMGLNRPNFIAAILFLVILYLVSRHEENVGSCRDLIAGRQIVIRWAVYYALVFSILVFGIYGPGYNVSDFIYMNF